MIYELKFLDIVFKRYDLPETACVFCEYCTDVLYDSYGIHTIWCDKRNHCADFGNVPNICKEFKADAEVRDTE